VKSDLPVRCASRSSAASSHRAEQVGKIAAAARVKKLVLTHLIPLEDAEKMRELAVKKGEIVVGKNWMRVLP
jgi:ribonuclease BN (tRNA processing enzyme)